MNVYGVPKKLLLRLKTVPIRKYRTLDDMAIEKMTTAPYGHMMAIMRCTGKQCAECITTITENNACPVCESALAVDELVRGYGTCVCCKSMIRICAVTGGRSIVTAVSQMLPAFEDDPADCI